ncbi:MAG TPA: hypothetical protein VN222_13315, partial [Novosphingobium sp.]|nr:hypothetical protein [Novosphingobium sp.]
RAKKAREARKGQGHPGGYAANTQAVPVCAAWRDCATLKAAIARALKHCLAVAFGQRIAAKCCNAARIWDKTRNNT